MIIEIFQNSIDVIIFGILLTTSILSVVSIWSFNKHRQNTTQGKCLP